MKVNFENQVEGSRIAGINKGECFVVITQESWGVYMKAYVNGTPAIINLESGEGCREEVFNRYVLKRVECELNCSNKQ
jgi:hypothetical protein